jgi:hypothetical protein
MQPRNLIVGIQHHFDPTEIGSPEPVQHTPGAAQRNKLDEMDAVIRESRRINIQETENSKEKEEADRIEAEKQEEPAVLVTQQKGQLELMPITRPQPQTKKWILQRMSPWTQLRN